MAEQVNSSDAMEVQGQRHRTEGRGVQGRFAWRKFDSRTFDSRTFHSRAFESRTFGGTQIVSPR